MTGAWPRGSASQLGGLDTAQLAADVRALVDKPRTFRELGALLAERWPGYPPAALAQAIRALVPLVQMPPRAIWGAAGPSPDQLVIRYLAAFGPATVKDMQA